MSQLQMKSNRRKKKKAEKKGSEFSPEELASMEHDFMVEMFGAEDAAYFEAAGIDDIGDKEP